MTILHMQHPRKISFMMMVSIIICTFVAAYMISIKPLFVERNNINIELQERKSTYLSSTQSNLTNSLDKHKKNIDTLHSKIQADAENRSAEEIIPSILLILDQISNTNKIQLIGVKPLETKRVEMFDQVEFDIRAKGKYKDVYSWLSSIEKTLQPMRVKMLNITRSNSLGLVEVQLHTNTYLIPTEE